MSIDLALHAEPMERSSTELRWVLPTVRLPVGRLVAAPGRLGELLADGSVEQAWCEPHSVRIMLGPGGTWRQCGDLVRAAIREAVLDLAGWRTDGDRDATLRTIVEDVLAGPVGDYITSHGGQVEVSDVVDDVVTVRFSGACGHCPLSGITLHQRIEVAVRDRYPDLSGVVEAAGSRPVPLPVKNRARRFGTLLNRLG